MMKMAVVCMEKGTEESFVDEITIHSEVITDKSAIARTIRNLYESDAQNIEVLGIHSIEEALVGAW